MHKTAAETAAFLDVFLPRVSDAAAGRRDRRRAAVHVDSLGRAAVARYARALGRTDDALGAGRRVHRRDQRADAARVRRDARDPRPFRAARALRRNGSHRQPESAHRARARADADRRGRGNPRRAQGRARRTSASSRRRAPHSTAIPRGSLDRACSSRTNRSGRSARARTAIPPRPIASWRRFAPASTASIATPILYGGSMTAVNVASYVEQPNINGGLVGGASLDPAGFAALIANAVRPSTGSG